MNFDRFKNLGINNQEDLLNHIPSRYIDYSSISTISNLKEGEVVTIHATVNSLKNIATKRGIQMQIGSVSDSTGKISVVWFNQNYLIKFLHPGKLVSLSGKVKRFSGRLSLNSPEYELLSKDDQTIHTGKIVPIYPETAGISSKFLRSRVKKVLEVADLREFLSKEDLANYKLIDLASAYKSVHFPKSLEETTEAKKRLAFNELLFLQLNSLKRKLNWDKNKTKINLKCNQVIIEEFKKLLNFSLTKAQERVINEIVSDFLKNSPMNRLLEGDVGSGKTVVAAFASFVAYKNGYSTIFMAPTQILANQHYFTLKKLFPKLKISLITANSVKNEAYSDIFIGTHALLHKKIDFKKVALVIIDEQHRFGVEQRKHLVNLSAQAEKSETPHVLTMTATPIPRTIAQISFGDLDLSILDEMPAGRQKITTWVIPEAKRKKAYDWIKSQILDLKSQAFVICPLIEVSEHETLKDIKNVTSEFLNLKKEFPNLKLGLLHGQIKAKEKDEVLKKFKKKQIDILVTTSVVEVGIDIPDATIMIIESAERFGLAQLHQLRGRVGRSSRKSYCLLFSNIKYSRRLNAMTKTNSGFELAELDLKLRGPGEVFGTMQHGFTKLKVASWSQVNLIKDTKELALKIMASGNYKKLRLKYTHGTIA